MVISEKDVQTPVRHSRPILDATVQVRFTNGQMAVLRLLAAESGQPVSAVVRNAVTLWTLSRLAAEDHDGDRLIDVEGLVGDLQSIHGLDEDGE
jgi:hypothetical protein